MRTTGVPRKTTMDVTITLTFEGKEAVTDAIDLLEGFMPDEEPEERPEPPLTDFNPPEYPAERKSPDFTGDTAGREYAVEDDTFERSQHFYPVLYAVSRMERATFRETCNWLKIHSTRDHKEGSVSGALTFLKESGYLTATIADGDKRAFAYSVTEKGEEAIRAHPALLYECGLFGADGGEGVSP